MTSFSYHDIAKLFDHALLAPTLTDAELLAGCAELRQYPIATVCIKPHAVPLAVKALAGTEIEVCTVIGFPHGTQVPEIKALETEQAAADGAKEVDMVINTGKALSGDWDFIRRDIGLATEVAHSHNLIMKVIFETDFLPQDDTKIRLCQICGELGVDFVKTSTGFGFVKGEQGGYDYAGATDHDLKLMRRYCPPSVGVKASGGMRSLDRVLEVVRIGVTRVGTTSTSAILEEFTTRCAK